MVNKELNVLQSGMTNSHPMNIKENQYLLVLNGNIQTDTSGPINLTNEHSNILCNRFPEGYKVIGSLFVPEKNITYIWLVNPITQKSQIGYLSEYSFIDFNDSAVTNFCYDCTPLKDEETPLEQREQIPTCVYNVVVDSDCLNFNIDYPIRKAEIKRDNCGDTIYFTDALNPIRGLKLTPSHTIDDSQRAIIGYTGDCTDICAEIDEDCNCVSDPGIECLCCQPVYGSPTEIDCNKLRLIPISEHICIEPIEVIQGGSLRAGTYQLAASYAISTGQRATRTFSVSNPVSIFDPNQTVVQGPLSYPTDLGVKFLIKNLDGQAFDYIDVFVIATINRVPSVKQYSSIDITKLSDNSLEYTITDFEKGLDVSIDDILQIFPVYETAQEITASGDTLLLGNLTGPRDLNLQRAVINMSPHIKWITAEANEDLYNNGVNAAKYRTYLRDEVYPLGIVFERNNTLDTCAYPLIGRAMNSLVRPGYTFRGQWNPETNYVINDIVEFTTASYVAVSNNINSQPPSVNWAVSSTADPYDPMNPHAPYNEYYYNYDRAFVDGDDVFQYPGCDPDDNNLRWQVYNTGYNLGTTCDPSSSGIQCVEKIDTIVCSSFTYNALPRPPFTPPDPEPPIPVTPNCADVACSEDTICIPADCYIDPADKCIPCADNYPSLRPDVCDPQTLSDGCNPGFVRTLTDAQDPSLPRLCIDSTLVNYPSDITEPYVVKTNSQEVIVSQETTASYYVYDLISTVEDIPDFDDPTPNINLEIECESVEPADGVFIKNPLYKDITLPNVPPDNYLGINAKQILVAPDNTCLTYTPAVAPLMYFLGDNIIAPADYEDCTGADWGGDYWGVGTPNIGPGEVNNTKYQSYWFNFYANSVSPALVIKSKLFWKSGAFTFSPGDIRIDVYQDNPFGVPVYSTGMDSVNPATFYYDGSGTPGDVDTGVLIIGDVANSTGDTTAAGQFPLIPGTQYFIHIYLLPLGIVKVNAALTVPNLSYDSEGECPCYVPDYAWASVCVNSPKTEIQKTVTTPEIRQLRCTYELHYSVNEVVDSGCEIQSFEYGDFGYHELKTKTYPNNPEVWGNLCGRPIRHFRFPDCFITHLQDQDPLIVSGSGPFNTGRKAKIYPIGIRIDAEVVKTWLEWAVTEGLITDEERLSITGYKIVRGNRVSNKSIMGKGILMDMWKYNQRDYVNNQYSVIPTYYSSYPFNDLRTDPYLNKNGSPFQHPFGGLGNDRFSFHSPETSFNGPSIGQELKFESTIFGNALGNFYEVRNHPKYTLLSNGGIALASTLAGLNLAADLLVLIGTQLGNYQVGLANTIPVGSIVGIVGGALASAPSFFVYAKQWRDIILNFGVPRNFAKYYAAVSNYHSSGTLGEVPNAGNKRRLIVNSNYLLAGNLSISEQGNLSKINNYQRENSVYLHINEDVKYAGTTLDASTYPDLADTSRFIMSSSQDGQPCALYDRQSNVASYYASIKYYRPDQYGSIQDIEWIYTGNCGSIIWNATQDTLCEPIFGGDQFISRYTEKIKIPFFLDNPVAASTSIDFQYRTISNITDATYFFNSVGESTLNSSSIQFKEVEHKFDCEDTGGLYLNGTMYLFSYGILSYIGESDFNLNFRHAENTRDKDFYPHQSDIENWTQEYRIPIETPNYYFYNRDYSKQNKENFFCTQPVIYNNNECLTTYPNRVITSLPDGDSSFYSDPWRVFLANDYKDFPLVNGQLIGLDGIEREKVLVRFENTSLVFNAYYTMTTDAGVAQIGTSSMFAQKPMEYAKSDIGYGGTQHHAFVSTQFGHFWVDAKRSSVFMLPPESGLQEISQSYNTFFNNNLPFFILKDFPNFDVDNNYKNIGITLCWDNRFDRLFITKLDFQLKDSYRRLVKTNLDSLTSNNPVIILNDNNQIPEGELNGIYYVSIVDEITIYQLLSFNDSEYFCNKSWTIGYSPLTKSWISYYSFVPNYYIGHENYFQSGINYSQNSDDSEIGIWNHLITNKSYQVFYGKLYPFIADVVIKEQFINKQLHSIEYQSDFLRYQNDYDYFYNPGVTFNKAVIWAENQNTGNLNLVPQVANNLSQSLLYPLVGPSSTSVLVSRKENMWRINQFSDLVKSKTNNVPTMLLNCHPYLKNVNNDAVNYYKPTFERSRLVSDYFILRLINDDKSNYNLIYKWSSNNTIKSYS